MLPSTSSSFELPQNILTNIQYYPRRLLLETPPHHLKPTTPPAPPPNDLLLDHSSARGDFNANLIMVVTVLLCALICSLCISCIIRCVIKCTSLINQEPNYNINTTSHEVIITKSGIDKRALRTFPIVKYSKEVKIQGLDTDCVICLSEFKGGEKLRILPKCTHGFHVKCIDKWLNSQSSCPTCRQSLVDTCQKIIGSDDHQTGEMVAISIVRLEREDLVRNYRGQVSQT